MKAASLTPLKRFKLNLNYYRVMMHGALVLLPQK